MKFRFRPVITAVLVLLFATGCGQKGPLILPEDEEEDRIEIPSRNTDDSADNNPDENSDDSANDSVDDNEQAADDD